MLKLIQLHISTPFLIHKSVYSLKRNKIYLLLTYLLASLSAQQNPAILANQIISLKTHNADTLHRP